MVGVVAYVGRCVFGSGHGVPFLGPRLLSEYEKPKTSFARGGFRLHGCGRSYGAGCRRAALGGQLRGALATSRGPSHPIQPSRSSPPTLGSHAPRPHGPQDHVVEDRKSYGRFFAPLGSLGNFSFFYVDHMDFVDAVSLCAALHWPHGRWRVWTAITVCGRQ